MCVCNPLCKTPWCGKPGCEVPVQEPECQVVIPRRKEPYLNLWDLVDWLKYGETSGYKASRCTEQQEIRWSYLLEALLKSTGQKRW